MALFARAGHRLVRINSPLGGVTKISSAKLHLAHPRNSEYYGIPPEGYDKTNLPKKSMPKLIDKTIPMTPEERAEYAAKYNLRPEDYEPMELYGDYPKLPNETATDRDPYYEWDQPSLRRNHGEPLHVHQEIYDQFSPMDRRALLLDRKHYIRFFMCLIGGFFTLYLIGRRFPKFEPIGPKHLPEEFPGDDGTGANVGKDWWFTDHKSKEVVHYGFK